MKTLTEHEKAFIRYQKNEYKVMLDWFNAIRSIFIIFLLAFAALVFLTSCGSREDDPTPEPTYTLTLTGNWKVKKIQNGTTITPNSDNSLFVNVANGNIKYKLPSGATYDGWGKVNQPSNAESINLDNGTKLIMFKTMNADGDINFNFTHANGTKDDVWVRLY